MLQELVQVSWRLGFSAGVANFNPTPFNGQHKITMMGATAVSKGYFWILVNTIGRLIFKAWKMKEASQSSFLESLSRLT